MLVCLELFLEDEEATVRRIRGELAWKETRLEEWAKGELFARCARTVPQRFEEEGEVTLMVLADSGMREVPERFGES